MSTVIANINPDSIDKPDDRPILYVGNLTGKFLLCYVHDQIFPMSRSMNNTHSLSLQHSGRVPADGTHSRCDRPIDQSSILASICGRLVLIRSTLLTPYHARSLASNQLTGTIPEAIGQLVNLQHLYVDWVMKRGFSSHSLSDRHLNRNKLTGTIPEVLGHLTDLQSL